MTTIDALFELERAVSVAVIGNKALDWAAVDTALEYARAIINAHMDCKMTKHEEKRLAMTAAFESFRHRPVTGASDADIWAQGFSDGWQSARNC